LLRPFDFETFIHLHYPSAPVGCVMVHRLRADSSGSAPALDHQSTSFPARWQFAVMRPAQRDGEFVADFWAPVKELCLAGRFSWAKPNEMRHREVRSEADQNGHELGYKDLNIKTR
jgi:hypothetical protein